jgi:MFS transporter, FHS family, glucose/mannose:H+ symporter
MVRTSVTALLGVAFAALFAGGLLDNIRGPLLPDMIADLGIADRHASLFFSLAAIASVGGSVLAGKCLRHFSSLATLRGSLMIIALGYGAVAFGSTYWMILAGGICYGLGMGSNHVILNCMVAQATAPSQRTRSFNFLHVMYGLAALSAPLLITWLRVVTTGWQQIFLLSIGLPLLIFSASLPVASPRPRAVDAGGPRPHYLRLLFTPTCLYYAAVFGLYVAAELCVSIWLVLYVDRLGTYTLAQSTNFLTLFFVAMTAIRLLMGLFLKGHHYKRILLISSSGGVFFGCLGIYGHPIFLSLSAAAMAPFFPVMFASLSHEVTEDLEVVTSWVMGTVFVAIALGQAMMGWLSDHYSMAVAMHLPVVLLVVVSMALWLRRFPSIERLEVPAPISTPA